MHCEQHQPVNLSPSTQIKRLLIHLYLLRAFGVRARARRVEHINRASAEGDLLPVVADNVPWIHRSAPQTDATDQRFQQKARELESGCGAAFRVVQLRSRSQELESDSGDAEPYRESRLEYR
jgi:hypothetical protein